MFDVPLYELHRFLCHCPVVVHIQRLQERLDGFYLFRNNFDLCIQGIPFLIELFDNIRLEFQAIVF